MIDNMHKKNLKTLINSFNYKFFENISISRKKAFDDFFLRFYKNKIKNNILTFFFDSKRKIYFSLYKDRNIKAYEVLNYNEHKLFLIYDCAKKKYNYKKIADIGANIGFHSIILDKLGYRVDSFEPDPDSFKILETNLKKNKCKKVKAYNFAVFNKEGIFNFTKVKNHPMASHISGKKKAYGNLEYIKIKALDIKSIIIKYDLVKIDAEGSEAEIICALKNKDLQKCDIVCEVTNLRNKELIFKHCKKQNILIYSSKNMWSLVKKKKNMPDNHTEGFIILSTKINFFEFIKQK